MVIVNIVPTFKSCAVTPGSNTCNAGIHVTEGMFKVMTAAVYSYEYDIQPGHMFARENYRYNEVTVFIVRLHSPIFQILG